VTAALLFIAVRFLLVVPIKRVVGHMTSYAEAPDDASRIIEPQGSVRELRDAETALQSMQTQLTGALRQRERLAQLGEAVAKISHDLRNILSVTTLMADRLEGSADPAVQRATPKILASLTRAVNLTEATLAFGRAEEPSPKLERVRLADIAEDVVENERLTRQGDRRHCITYVCEVPATWCCAPIPNSSPRAVEPRAQRAPGHRGARARRARSAIAASSGTGLADRGQRHRPGPAEKGARSPVQAVPWRRAQGRLGPRPRHRGRDHPRPWRALELVKPVPRARPSPSACPRVSPPEPSRPAGAVNPPLAPLGRIKGR
jgi:hypothetical protein